MSAPQSVRLPAATGRLQSVDAVRGLIMIVMAIDHVRDFFHAASIGGITPEDLTRSWPALFLTRWITHICAPGFQFLAGISVWLWASRGKSRAEAARFLVTRGLWLIALDVIFFRFALFFDIVNPPIFLAVLWSLGFSMLTLAALQWLPIRVLAPLSIAVIALHNLLDPLQAKSFGSMAWLWDVLHQQGVFTVLGKPVVSFYPVVPWFAVMALGYCLGPVFTMEPARRRRVLLQYGAGVLLAFVLVRGLNVYGDPRPWTTAVAWPVLSFLNTTKYPPSLSFLLMTLGQVILLLGVFDRVRLSRNNPMIVFGRVPLFYFVGHFLLAHLLTFPLGWMKYGNVGFLLTPVPTLTGSQGDYPAGYGYSLAETYGVWLLVLLIMYPLCRAFSQLKENRPEWWWLRYL